MAEDAETITPPPETVTEPDAVADAPAQEAVADDPVSLLARKMGWKTEDQWQGEEGGWTDALTFIDQQSYRDKKELAEVKKGLHDVGKTTAALVARETEKARAEALAEVKRAAYEGDAQAIEDAAANLDRVNAQAARQSGPPPEVQAFVERNSWMLADEDARGFAVRTAQRVANAGGSVDAQLEAAEKAVRKRFPEYFDETPERPKPKAPPALQGGNRSAAAPARKKGVADLSEVERSAAQKLIRSGMIDTIEEYATLKFQKENAQ